MVIDFRLVSRATVRPEVGCVTAPDSVLAPGRDGALVRREDPFMTCYMISQGGEPVAVVSDIDMARAIAECQPWGEYLVEQLEVGEPVVSRPSRGHEPPIDLAPSRHRRRSVTQSPRWTYGVPGRAIEGARPHAR